MKRRDNVLPYDVVFSGGRQDDRLSEDNEHMKFYNELINQTIEQITDMVTNDEVHHLNENEKRVGFALIEILNNWEEIFTRIETKKFNKTSVYYFIKEITMLSTKEVRDAMKKFKNVYFLTKQKIIDE